MTVLFNRILKRKNTPYEFLIVSLLLNSALIMILPNIGKISFLHILYFAMTFSFSNLLWLALERFTLFKGKYGLCFILAHTLTLFFFIMNAYHYTIFSEHLGLGQIWVGITGIFTGEAKIGLGNYLAFIQQSSVIAIVSWLMLLFLISFPRRRKHPRPPYLTNLKLTASFIVVLSGFMIFKPSMADTELESIQEAIPYISFVEFEPLYPEERFRLEDLRGVRSLEKQQLKSLQSFRNQLDGLSIEAQNKPNIIFLHLESLRADMLSPEVMPKLYEWGNTKGEILPHHYTTSSNTTAGMFGLLHGLAGSYFQIAPVGDYFPLPLDILDKLGYSVNTYHGKSLSYDNMYGRFFEETQDHDFYGHSGSNDAENDKSVLEQFLQDIDDPGLGGFDKRFDYIKLDSTHWNYSYPSEYEKFLPVIEADFAITSLLNLHMKGFRQELLNRYRNAAYYTDHIVSQFLNDLESRGYLENSIIIIVGDHGEEFWEHGRFGHIYGLSREQIHVVGLMRFPEKVNSQYTMSSHQDIFPTIFSYMNLSEDTEALFTGKNLYSYDENLDFSLASLGTIGRMTRYTEAVMSPELKIEFSLNETLEIHKISDLDDEVLEEFSINEVRKLILKSLEMKTDLSQDDQVIFDFLNKDYLK